MYKRIIKRILDIVCAILALIVFSWLYAILAVLVRIKLGKPVIFSQMRVGKNEKLFKLYKFRSMTDARDSEGNLLSDEHRLTEFGKKLRATSLDELPEAWNILRGDMSLIGPRPWGPAYVPYYTEEEHHRHDVRPGLSGLAQVRGRTAASWDERLKSDLEYVSDVSFLNDVKILFMTIKKVIIRSDVVEPQEQMNFDDYRRLQWERGNVKQMQGTNNNEKEKSQV